MPALKRNSRSRGKPKLLDRVRRACRLCPLSLRTEKAYAGWVRRWIYCHGVRHPATMGAPEVRRYLTYLAQARDVARRGRARFGVEQGGGRPAAENDDRHRYR